MSKIIKNKKGILKARKTPFYIYKGISVRPTVDFLEGFPWWLSGKESSCIAGTTGNMGSIPGSGRSPGGGHGNPLQYSCLENPHGQRSLEGYSPLGCKESDTTEET